CIIIAHIKICGKINLEIQLIEIPDNSITELTKTHLPPNWYQFPAPTILSEIGQSWVDGEKK
ncbi:MAG: hypothetical protein ACFCU6_07455, partial [Balneolaceae bacterium]